MRSRSTFLILGSLWLCALIGFCSSTDEENTNRESEPAARRRGILEPLLKSNSKVERVYALIELGREDEAMALLNTEPQLINAPLDEEDPQSLVESAIRYGSLDLLRFFIAHGADLTVPCSWGMTTLQTAIAARGNDRLAAAKALLHAGADPNARHHAKSGFSNDLHALHLAVGKGDPRLVRLLLKYGADPNGRDGEGNTPLHHLFSWRSSMNLDILKALLENGASANAVNNDGETVLFSLSPFEEFDRWPEVIEAVVRRGADVNHRSADGDTALHHTVRAWMDMEQIETLLKLGADPTITNNGGTSPLSEAQWELNWLRERDTAAPERIQNKERVIKVLQECAARGEGPNGDEE